MEYKKSQMENLGRLKKFFNNKKILITGITGFTGSWMSIFLQNFNCKIYGFGLHPITTPNLFHLTKIQNFTNTEIIDIRDKKKVFDFVKKSNPDILIHLAAQPLIIESFKNPTFTFETNFNGTLNLLEVCRFQKKLKKIIILTTDKVYKNNDKKNFIFKESENLGGSDPYSSSKCTVEELVKCYSNHFLKKKNISIIRAGNIIGGGDWSENRLIPDIINSWKNKKTLLVRGLGNSRPWQHVTDVVISVCKLIIKQNKNYYSSFNLSLNNKSTSVKKVISEAKKYLSFEHKMTSRNNKIDKLYLNLNSSKIKKFLKYSHAMNTKKSIQFTIEWYKKYYNNEFSAKNLCLRDFKKNFKF